VRLPSGNDVLSEDRRGAPALARCLALRPPPTIGAVAVALQPWHGCDGAVVWRSFADVEIEVVG